MGATISYQRKKFALWRARKADYQSLPFRGKVIPARISAVKDGDTCSLQMVWGGIPIMLAGRIAGIDTPEISSQQQWEAEAAAAVGSHMRSLYLNRVVSVKMLKWDKYGGRVDCEVEGWAEYILRQGLGKPYDGGEKKKFTQAECVAISRKIPNIAQSHQFCC